MTGKITIDRAVVEQVLGVLDLIDGADITRGFLRDSEVGKIFDAIQNLRNALSEADHTSVSPELEKAINTALWLNTPAVPPGYKPGPLAQRRVFDAIRGAYDLGYNDARNSESMPGDNAPGYKGRDVETDHGNALLRALTTAPQPQPAKQPLKRKQRLAVFITAEHAMDTNPYLSWREAIVVTVEAAHGITGSKE